MTFLTSLTAVAVFAKVYEKGKALLEEAGVELASSLTQLLHNCLSNTICVQGRERRASKNIGQMFVNFGSRAMDNDETENIVDNLNQLTAHVHAVEKMLSRAGVFLQSGGSSSIGYLTVQYES